MTTAATDLDAAAVLCSVRRARQTVQRAEAQLLTDAVAWAGLHRVADVEDAATWAAAGFGDTGIALAGEGAPLVSEFCVAEFGAALGMSTDAARALLAEALELAHRLPALWARVQGGDLPAWRARRIAAETLCLSAAAAEHVDSQLAPFAHRTGPAQTQRLVEEAIGRFMPSLAAQRRRESAEGRHFAIDHGQVSFAGTSAVHGELDLADALDLEAAVAASAAQLKQLGSTEALDVRRAAAVGELARRQLALALEPTVDPQPGVEVPGRIEGLETAALETPRRNGRRNPPARRVVLHIHLSEDALRSHCPDAPARVENAGPHLVTAGQVAAWCGLNQTQVRVQPVIDLADHTHHDCYEVPDRLRQQVIARDVTCSFPWCTRPARGCDLDHVIPYTRGGATCAENLAPLCRRHHRLKTHCREGTGWAYTMVEPGTYLWRSPHGHTYLRDHRGTTDLNPDPADPPRPTDALRSARTSATDSPVR